MRLVESDKVDEPVMHRATRFITPGLELLANRPVTLARSDVRVARRAHAAAAAPFVPARLS